MAPMGGCEVKPDIPDGSQRVSKRGSKPPTVNSDIYNVRPCSRSGEHRRSRDTGGIVRMDVDREVRILLADRADQTVEQ